MAGDELPFGVEALRQRFLWFGLLEIDEPSLSSGYREIVAGDPMQRSGT